MVASQPPSNLARNMAWAAGKPDVAPPLNASRMANAAVAVTPVVVRRRLRSWQISAR